MNEPFAVEGCEGPYKDYLSFPTRLIQGEMELPKSKRKGPRGGVSEPFPVKLYEMLVGVQQEDATEIVSWQSHGRCFLIHDTAQFVADIMPRYFKMSKLTSLQRQLNLYGFQRVTSGRDRGAYYHPLFLRGRPDICRIMLRTRVKGGAAAILPSHLSTNAIKPSFYVLPVCPEDSIAAVSESEGEETDEPHSSSPPVHSTTPPIIQSLQATTDNDDNNNDDDSIMASDTLDELPVVCVSAENSVAGGVPNPLHDDDVDYPQTECCFFEGQKFISMDPDNQRAFETELYRRISYSR